MDEEGVLVQQRNPSLFLPFHAKVAFIRFKLNMSENTHKTMLEAIDFACEKLKLTLDAEPLYIRAAVCYDLIYQASTSVTTRGLAKTTNILQNNDATFERYTLSQSSRSQLYIQTGNDAFKLLDRINTERFEDPALQPPPLLYPSTSRPPSHRLRSCDEPFILHAKGCNSALASHGRMPVKV